ncbi:hypothetical protein NE237_031666 [Protea cynaroides]|uniref:KIB1-4 beta-propeller domain-containing protein n=1 Tax=Protea cynaroides TaxID=273540 RepID=A0A9Q0L2Q6_9MAGN|nr:hypothetical protein NE237_031666 [Protea cynaroides]
MTCTMDWSGLLPELMELMLDRLTHISDHFHFASVCSSWKSVTIKYGYHRRHLPRQLPVLMLPDKDNTEARNFLSLSSGKCYGFHIPEIHRKWCGGSSQGWLITVDESTGEIQLFNPVSRSRVLLPSLSTFYLQPEYIEDPHPSDYISKAALSANPCRTLDYVILAIVGHDEKLAYYQSGADKWINMRTNLILFEDVIYYKGLFYAVCYYGAVLSYDFSFEPPIETLITGRSTEGRTCDMYYLVESLGELLLVLRHFNDTVPNKTVRFEVCKLDERKREWIQMKSIGDRILFLGYGCSTSIAAQDFPECKRNSIYFNDDYCYRFLDPPIRYRDIGVFDFENESVESFYDDSLSTWTTPSYWITPIYPYLFHCIEA